MHTYFPNEQIFSLKIFLDELIFVTKFFLYVLGTKLFFQKNIYQQNIFVTINCLTTFGKFFVLFRDENDHFY